MKWRSDSTYRFKLGTERIVTKFVIMPTQIKYSWYWLETITIRQVIEYNNDMTKLKWYDREVITKDKK